MTTEAPRLDREAHARDRKAFQELVRTAGRRLRPDGWKASSAGATLQTVSGHWGQIVVNYVSGIVPLQARLFAGVVSPYLMRVANRTDPAKPPAADLVAAHAWVVWSAYLGIAADAGDVPAPLDLSAGTLEFASVSLGPSHAPAWLEATFDQLAPRVRALCDDRVIRDWLLDETRGGGVTCGRARNAALLTRHLGLDDELPAILDLAARRRAESALPCRDDQATHPQDWSHERFLRFLDETPP